MNPIVSNGNKLRWRFRNIKNLNEDGMRSETFSFAKIDWKMRIRTLMKNNKKFLSIHVDYEGENKNEKNWICETMDTTKLMNQEKYGDFEAKTTTVCYDETEYDWGYEPFHSWSELEPDGFIKDDSIIVEIDLSFKYYDFSKKIANFTDLTIDVEGTSFFVNKWLLCSRVEYFYDLSVNKKSEDTVIKMENVEVEIFRIFIASCYPFFSEIESVNLEKLVAVAQKFGAKDLHRICEQFLMSNDDRVDLMDKIRYAENNDYEKLMKQCVESLETTEEIKEIQQNDKFFDLKNTTKLRIMTRLLDLV